jgi:hypothetical protein
MTPVECVKLAEQRILAVCHGETDTIVCPFCSQTSVYGQMLCCENLATMVVAITDRLATGEQLENVEKVVDQMEKIAAKQRESVIVMN